jgi:hypothetical protein
VGCLGGPSGPPRHGPCPVCLSGAHSVFGLFVGFKGGFPGLFKGTPRAVPDSSPRASVGLPLRLPQMLEPADRMFFPPGLANAFRGAASADPRV